MDLQSTSVSTPAATLDLYPSEEPEKPELGVWLDRNGAILQRSGHGPIMRDEIPPGLHQLAFQKDMPDIPSLSAEDRAKVGPMDAIKHDLLVAENTRKKLAAEQAYNAGLRECKSKLAAHIELAMRKTAPLRLKTLQLKHKDPRFLPLLASTMAALCGGILKQYDTLRRAHRRQAHARPLRGIG